MRSAALLLLAIFVGMAPQQQTARIEGIVVRSDNGAAIPGARIVLLPQNPQDNAGAANLTDSKGRFVLKDITPGRYRLIASESAYMFGELGQKRVNVNGSPIDIAAGQLLRDVTLRMTPGSVVAGRVIDETGRPMPSSRVQLLMRRYTADGRVIAQMQGGGDTNDLGEYRLFWIPPGSYYVAATSQIGQVFRENGVTINDQSEGTEGLYLPTFYPNSLSTDQAEPVTVAPGSEIRGIDFVLTRMHTVRVSGQLIDGTTGEILPRTTVFLNVLQDGWAKLRVLPSTMTDPKGSFEFRSVPAGTYTIGAISTTLGSGRMSSPVEIQIGDKSVSGLRAVVQRTPVVRGRVVFESGTPATQIGSLGFEGVSGGDDGGTGIEEDGSFLATALGTGIFRIRLHAEEGYFVTSSRSGSRNVLRDGLDTRSPSIEPIEIRVGFSSAEVNGTVTDTADQPDGGVRVVLIPDSDRAMRVELFRNTFTDQLGRFTFKGVAPGDYKVFAWNDIEPYLWFDPAFMQLFESRGTPVHVEKTGAVSVRLRSFSP